MFPPQRKQSLNATPRRLPWSSQRTYSESSYNVPKSFWERNKSRIVVGGVIGLCCGTFFCQWTAAKLAKQGDRALYDWIQRNFINSAENIKERRWWVMVSSSFAHLNLVHLSFNMLCLWGFGTSFIAVFGASRFVWLWLFSAASCSAAQVYWQTTQERLRMETASRRWGNSQEYTILGIPISRERALAISGGGGIRHGGSAGASGVVCGLTGLFVCFVPKMPTVFIIFPTPLWVGELIFTVGSAFCMATGYAPIFGHAGHLGGTAAGIAYYFGVARPWLRRAGRL